MLKAVLFDLDGTLVDSAPDIAGALNDLLAEEGRSTYSLAAIKRMVGDGVHRLVEKAFGETGRTDQLAERFLDLYTPRSTRLTVPGAGAFAALDALRDAGVRLAVCTNKPDEAARVVLAELGLLPYFPVVIGGSSGLPRKPDPATLLEAARRLGAAPEETLMVGDSVPDVAAARAAGMRVLVVNSGYGTVPADKLGADGVLSSLGEIPHWDPVPAPAS